MSSNNSIEKTLSSELSISISIVKEVIQLFNEGATVPFIARYRKELTGGMSDEALRDFHSRWHYLIELEKRRDAISGLLSDLPNVPKDVFKALSLANTKSELEDIYAPYKKTRKTKADAAIELGLWEFALGLWSEGSKQAQSLYAKVSPAFKQPVSFPAAMEGARDIILERLSQNTGLIKQAKLWLFKEGELVSGVIRGKKELGEKYQDYFEYTESLKKIPPHRLLALFRGKKEAILKLNIISGQKEAPYLLHNSSLMMPVGFPESKERSPSKEKINWLNQAWQEKILPKIETDILAELKEKAEESAIQVFQSNLKDLLMAAPAGAKRTLALDPGFRNGVKWAAVDENGRYLESGVVYPHPPQNRSQDAKEQLARAIKRLNIDWVVIGNGTASRETEVLAKQLIKEANLSCQCVIVSEAGASVYSASKEAIQEFPELDVTIRGAVSIARRFQDPLAELVKIDPQAIGVGQYQNDVKANRLSQALGDVVEDCVNAVGVDVNLASVSLLTYVSGLTERLAQNLIEMREQLGGFTSRAQIKKVKGIGDKAFEQCAGFLRIRGGKEPLDASSVHPESYSIVQEMAAKLRLEVANLIGNQGALSQLKLVTQSNDALAYTYQDILSELAKPGRDPRPEFHYAQFDDSVSEVADLQEGMRLEGVVTNVAAFGAFVDIGVHQDGLVHISQLADRFVKDPRDEVRVGEVIKVEVLEVDVKRKRIALKRV
ncbi:Tex family protein [Rhodanobacter aciditrophus]|uniref:Tex family protein n=1 Tax=Rhodanobacter aciditrophus TaxID=1623218 RepID=A0ABW4B1B3_9GAMM